jgi:DNA-directed RNA polymerase alpha subunit
MDEFDSVVKRATDMFYTAVRKSGEFVENTRVSYNINLEKEKIARIQSKIGAKIYKMYKDGEAFPEIFTEDLKIISEYEENIKNMEKNYTHSKPYIICCECSAKLSANSVYCPKCGARQTPEDPN